MNIFGLFERVDIINLPERVDRLQSIKDELRWVGVSSVEGRFRVFPAIRPVEPAGFPHIGWRGCFLSHLEILRSARDANLSRILILEDDALFPRSFVDSQEDLVRSIPNLEWDFIYFGHLIQSSERNTDCLVRFDGQLLTSHCYAVNGRILVRLVDFLESYAERIAVRKPEIDHGIDGILSLFREQNPDVVTLITPRAIVWQSDSKSDIDHGSGMSTMVALKEALRATRLGEGILKGLSRIKRRNFG